MGELTFKNQLSKYLLWDNPAPATRPRPPSLISQKVLIKSFGKSQFTHKFANLFVTLVIIEDTLTDLCNNWLLQNDFTNTFCEIKPRGRHWRRRRAYLSIYLYIWTANPDPIPGTRNPKSDIRNQNPKPRTRKTAPQTRNTEAGTGQRVLYWQPTDLKSYYHRDD